MIYRGNTELAFNIEHPELDLEEEIIVKVKWLYLPETPPSIHDDYGEPYDFTYEVKVLKASDWVTIEMIEKEIDAMNIFDIMNL